MDSIPRPGQAPVSARERFGFNLARLGRVWRQQLDADLLGRGVSYSRWVTLAYLARGGEGMQQKELAQFMGIEAPTLVRSLDALEREGLVQRRPHPEDGRAKTVHLAAAAAEELGRFNEAARSVRETLLEGIADADLATCLRVFEAVDRNARNSTARAATAPRSGAGP